MTLLGMWVHGGVSALRVERAVSPPSLDVSSSTYFISTVKIYQV